MHYGVPNPVVTIAYGLSNFCISLFDIIIHEDVYDLKMKRKDMIKKKKAIIQYS